MAPSRQSDMARIAIRTLFAATIACFMTASIAGKYLDIVACKVTKTRRLKESLKRKKSSFPQTETNHLTFHLAWRLPQLLPKHCCNLTKETISAFFLKTSQILKSTSYGYLTTWY